MVHALVYCRNIAGQIINQGDLFPSSLPLDEHCSRRFRSKLSNCVLAVLQVVLVDVSRQWRAEELAVAPSEGHPLGSTPLDVCRLPQGTKFGADLDLDQPK